MDHDDFDHSAAEGSKRDQMALRRKRRRRKSKHQDKGALAWLRGPGGARAILAGIAVAALGYGAVTWQSTMAVTKGYLGISTGTPKAQVRYALGKPAENETEATWHIAEQGLRLRVSFGQGDGVKAISCRQDPDRIQSCPQVLGIAVGSAEQDLVRRLGPASSEGFLGEDKLMVYPGLGYTFRLRRGLVEEITFHGSVSASAALYQVFWRLLP